MILGKIVGNVVSTVKHPDYVGQKVLVVRPVDADGKFCGKSVLALDTVQAGPGDTVLINDEGNSARMIFGSKDMPARTVIVGIVDRVDTNTAAH